MRCLKSSVEQSSRLFFWRDERGVTAIEYGLIACLMVALLVVALPTIKSSLTTIFTSIKFS